MVQLVAYVSNGIEHSGPQDPNGPPQHGLSWDLFTRFRKKLALNTNLEEDRDYIVTPSWGGGLLSKMESDIRQFMESTPRPDVIVTADARAIRILRRMGFPNDELPAVVAAQVHDPVDLLANNVRYPGKNFTGVLIPYHGMTWTRFQLLYEMVPTPKRFGILRYIGQSPAFQAEAQREVQEAAWAAQGLGLELLDMTVDEVTDTPQADSGNRAPAAGPSPAESIQVGLQPVIGGPSERPQHVDGIVVLMNAVFELNMKTLLDLLAGPDGLKTPTIFSDKEFVSRGGLMSYGLDRFELPELAAQLTAQILMGTKAQDIRLVTPGRRELAINEDEAARVGIEQIPPQLWTRATVLY